MGVGAGLYMYDVKSSRSLSHLLMSCLLFLKHSNHTSIGSYVAAVHSARMPKFGAR